MEGRSAAAALGRVAGSQAGAESLRQSQVQASLVDVSRSVERVDQLCAALVERLSGALRPTGPEVDKRAEGQVPREVKAPISDDLDAVRVMSDCTYARLQDILNRLEI